MEKPHFLLSPLEAESPKKGEYQDKYLERGETRQELLPVSPSGVGKNTLFVHSRNLWEWTIHMD
ncbi:MAG: hypothetical protein EOM87_06820 [Clostridia bacterium]|nr:hypothetical protein [Clostridia bacterium]